MKLSYQNSVSSLNVRVPQTRKLLISQNRRSVVNLKSVKVKCQSTKKEQQGDKVSQKLLQGAASLVDRGTSTCRTCKGQGSIQCSNCEGRGHVDRSHVHVNAIRRAVQRLQCIVDQKRCTYNTEYLQTNRCKQCHGAGYLTCQMCKGMGVRSGTQLHKSTQSK